MTDPAIKLFGKTIPLMESGSGSDSDPNPNPNPLPEAAAEEDKDMCKETTIDDETKEGDFEAQMELEQGELNSLSTPNDDDQQTSAQDIVQKTDSKAEPDQSEVDISRSGQDKVLKKPDKILPCPRCNSLDTKFCYYNNYNVNQPRHFCKNCQRYWTAGGTMRNVPVGAGRRKNKHSASSNYRQIIMSPEALASARGEGATDSCRPPITIRSSSEGNGMTVLKFGPEAQAPLCESMSSVLIGEQKRVEVNAEEPSCASSMTASHFAENQNAVHENVAHKEQPNPNGMQGYYPLQCYPWAYPWNPGWNNAAAAAAAMAAGRCSSELVNGSEMGNMSSIQWGPLPVLAAPPFCPATFPIPFMPSPAYWPAGTWNVPWMGGSSGGLSQSSSKSNSGCLGNSSPTLGKHSRDGSVQGEEKTQKSLWVPKTLRIDDPDEAAKSSIWATLGIKPYEGGGMFKPFQSKDEGKCLKSEASQVLHANPAALSRSQSFQEST